MKPSKQVFAVAGFTLREAVRRKSFLVTNVILAALVLGACILLPRLGGGTGMEITGMPEGVEAMVTAMAMDARCLVINGSQALPGAEEALAALFPGSQAYPPAQRDECLGLVKADGKAALVEIAAGDPPRVTITTKDMMSAFPSQAAWEALCNLYRAHRFAELGYDEAEAAGVLQSALPLAAETADPQGMSNYIVGMALMLLMFMTIYIYGYGVAMSVATEKSTRVMETLIVSAKPSRILLGKCIGMGTVGLMQLVGVLSLGFAGTKVFIPGGTFGGGFGLPDLTLGKAALLVAYFLMGYALFSMINSMCGAMVSKMEDLQSAMMPAALVSVFSFYGGYLTLGVTPAISGSSSAGSVTMLIPFTAPFAAPSVLLAGEVPPGTIAASICILLATIVLVSVVSGRVYSASVLHYGNRLRLADVRRMVRGK
ncbi:MAG: ABC transporter permease [Oscillospiraceae bacterium]|jgi:ABC-2 type transport system permease protein|nr:ABC transporter permease [Oscillospiraceae bacterium]